MKNPPKKKSPENSGQKGFVYEIRDPVTKGLWRMLSNHEEDPDDLLNRLNAFVDVFKLIERPVKGTITTIVIAPKDF